MRRMIDPKTLGGGGGLTAPARHWYCITDYNKRTYYTIITTKDYDFPIGKFTAIENFWTDDKYKPLHAAGSYPGAGLMPYGGEKILMTRFDFENDSTKTATITGIRYEQHNTFQQDMDVSTFFGQYIMKIF